MQDSKGYLWIGTNDGLNRYDGYNFKIFRNIPGEKNSLVENTINSLHEDQDGNIWISTNGGLCRYNYASNDFTTNDLFKKDRLGNFGQVIELNKDELMILSDNRVILLNRHSGYAVRIKDPVPHLLIHGLSKDKKGNIYLATSNADVDCANVFIYDRRQKIFKPFLFSLNLKWPEQTLPLYFDSRNSLWLGTSGKGSIFHYSPEDLSKDSVEVPALYENQTVVSSFCEDREGNIWIGTIKGILSYNYSSGKFHHYNYPTVNTIYRDRSGIIWFCTFEGLYKLNPTLKKFKHLTMAADSDPRLLHNFVLGFRPAAENKIWVNYYWGVPKFSLLDLSNNKITHHIAEYLNAPDFFKMITKNPEQIDDDTLKKHLPLLEEFGRKYVSGEGLFYDNQRKLWLLKVNAIRLLGDTNTIFGSEFISSQTWGNEIWVSTYREGLYSINTASRSISRHFTTTAGKNSISSNNPMCLLIEENGNTWIGFKENGLDYYDREKEIFKNYTTKDGLCNNSVFSLVKDDRGRLWIGTANGLSCFDSATKTFKNFSSSDGLINTEFNRESAIKLSNGYIVMGGMNGIDYFHPDSVLAPAVKPQVQITDFKVFNKSVFPFSGIRLAHDKNYVTIDFAAMDFRNPEANKFEYKLEGIDKNWVTAGKEHSISYARLSPGRYHFLVKAASSNGIWSKEPAEIYFIISTPWWKTWWFYSACVLAVAGLLFWFYKFRIFQLKKLMQLRTKISQDLHDDVGATLSGIRVFSQLAKERPGNNKEYLDKITHYSDDMLNKLSDIVWSINAENDSFEQLASKLRNYAQAMTTAKNIHLEFFVDPAIEKKDLDITLRKNIYMITREAINNAVKYSACSSLRIYLKPVADGAELIIADDGKGFDANNITTGNGLSNLHKRAEEIQGKLSVETSPGEGTTIRLLINFT